MRWVYLIHLDSPLGSDRKTAQHYLGSADDVAARLALHRSGRGAKLLAAAVARGIGFQVVRLWPGDRALERQLKQRGHAARLCPVCAGAACWRRGIVAPPPEQLRLPLETPAEFPAAPTSARMDWYEIATQRRWRQAATREPIDLAVVDSCL